MKKSICLLWPALLLFWVGCGPKPESQVPRASPQPIREAVAVVSFIRGEAKVCRDGTWSSLSLSQELAADDSLDIPAAVQVELKDREQKVYRLSGPAKGVAASLLAQAAKPEPRAGSQVISKIRKLEGGKQKLETRTPTAVAGIRGVKARAIPDTTKKDSLPE